MNLHIRSRAIVLIAAQVLLIGTSMFWDRWQFERDVVLTLIYTGFFCIGGYAMAQSKQWLKSYIVLIIGSVFFGMVDYGLVSAIGRMSCTLAAHFLLFKVILQHSFFKPNVPKSDRILAGVAGYILVGMFWSNFFMFLGENWPGSILNQVTGEATTRSQELYYSFVTITSLGYGDIVPATSEARVIATFAGLSGILYSAIFISAILSGLRIDGSAVESSDESK